MKHARDCSSKEQALNSISDLRHDIAFLGETAKWCSVKEEVATFAAEWDGRLKALEGFIETLNDPAPD